MTQNIFDKEKNHMRPPYGRSTSRRGFFLSSITCLILAFGFIGFGATKAQASCACLTNIPIKAGQASVGITMEFTAHKTWLIQAFYNGAIKPALGQMTEQLSAVALAQTLLIGTLFDAKHQLDTQLVIDQFQVDAVRDYQPSTALCKFGTATTALASSEQRSNINQQLFVKRSLDRQFGAKGLAAETAIQDQDFRVQQFATTYCNPRDNQGFLAGSEDAFCGQTGGDPARYNKDINYANTLEAPLTLNIDLTDTVTTPDEEDIFALGSNLFGYDLLNRPSISLLRENAEGYHAARAAIAKRSVAENSFYAIASEKASGTGASAQYLKQMVELLGLDNETDGPNGLTNAEEIIGQNPSYYAQMELLTKKIYQDPGFVVSLIDKPANVERQKAAMQSFRLMQQRDFYNSLVRQEMVLSVILEELLYERYNELQNEISSN